MPKLILESALRHFKDIEEDTAQVVTYGRFENALWYCKKPPADLIDPEAGKLRLLNEAICGKTMELLNESANKPFLTPTYRLVVGETGSLSAVLAQRVPYDYLGDRDLTPKEILTALPKPGLAEISTFRYFLNDPDGFNNIGYSEDKLSSIDYGLANYPELLKQNALVEEEAKRLSADHSKRVFSINIASVFTGILQSKSDETLDFMAHHAIEDFNEIVAAFCETNKEAVKSFLGRIRQHYKVIANVITSINFKEKIREELGINELSMEDQIICDFLINSLIERAFTLKDTLSTLRKCSPLQLEQMANKSGLDSRLSPVVLEASPEYRYSKTIRFFSLAINNVSEENARLEAQRAMASGRITPANGGGEGGYSSALTPLSLTHYSQSSPSRNSGKSWLAENEEKVMDPDKIFAPLSFK